MNLKEFIQETIVEICSGIEGANKELREKGVDALANPEKAYPLETTSQVYGVWQPDQPLYPTIQMLKFDVAVYAKEGTETKGGIGVAVASIVLGSEGKSQADSGSESRIQFGVPVMLPFGKK